MDEKSVFLGWVKDKGIQLNPAQAGIVDFWFSHGRGCGKSFLSRLLCDFDVIWSNPMTDDAELFTDRVDWGHI